MTPRQRRDRLQAAITSPPEGWLPWAIHGLPAIMWERETETPPVHREHGTWADPTYHQFVQIIMIGRKAGLAEFLVRVSRAPWVTVQCGHATLTRALAALTDPAGCLDS